MIPHLAGHATLAELRALYFALASVQLSGAIHFPGQGNDSLCPQICRAAAALACLVAGEPVPRPRRLTLTLGHILREWPGPVTSRSLARALDTHYTAEATKILKPMALAGILRAVPNPSNRVQVLYYFDEVPLAISSRNFHQSPRTALSLA
jgi:hypothetical protein